MEKIEKSGIIIKKGKEIINEIKKQYKYEQKMYNELLKGNQNLIYRATHVSRGKKIYHYWYRYEWDPVKKRTIHKYIGRTKPNEEIPDPPLYPLKDLSYKEIAKTQDIILSLNDYEKFKNYFKECEKQYIVKKVEKIK
ncbi:MAG: hypothetical protein ACTSRG_08780 [Candidatus Helarchaeota archaeon]